MKKYRIKYNTINCLYFLQKRTFFRWSNVVVDKSTIFNASPLALKQQIKTYLLETYVKEYTV